MQIEIVALIVSIVAVTISGIALGWNIVRDLVLRPRLIVKLKAELLRDFTRLDGNDGEKSFVISGTITPFKFRTTIGKLTLDIPNCPEPKRCGMPFSHFVGKTVDSGEPCEIAWTCQGALDALDKCGQDTDLVVTVHHSVAEKPFLKRIRLTITDRR